MAYVLPQVQVFQEFGQLPQNVVANLNAFIVGPHYQLFRHSVAAERELIGVGKYDYETNNTYAYPEQPSGSAVDLAYVKLVMENVWAQYAAIGASESTPLVCVSPVERNKLRAMPKVGQPERPKDGLRYTTNGVSMQAGGYVYNSPSIPEAFYFVPQGGALSGAISRLNAWSGAWVAEDATLAYVSDSEGQVGTVAVRATDNPLSNGVTIPGPYGMMLDFDVPGTQPGSTELPRTAVRLAYSATNITTGDQVDVAGTVFTADTDFDIGGSARTTVENLRHAINAAIQAGDITNVHECIHIATSPTTGHLYIIGQDAFEVTTDATPYTITGAAAITGGASAGIFNSLRAPLTLRFRDAATAYFVVTVDPQSLPATIDAAIDNAAALKFHVEYDATATAANFDPESRRITLTVATGATLDDVRDALVGNSDIAALLDATVIVGDPTSVLLHIADETTFPLTPETDVLLVPDAYRVRVTANDITWKTGNGTNHSAMFKNRGVRPGDMIRYSVVGPDSETYTGQTQIAAIETDSLAAYIADPTVDTSNKPADSGDLFTPDTGLDIIVAGSDNQRRFDGAQTKLYSLASAIPYYPGSYAAGVLADKFIVTITTGGLPGVARARIRTQSGLYSRINVPIMQPTWTPEPGSNAMGIMYIGNNLWITFEAGSGEDGVFQVNDTYTFSRAVQAPWTPLRGSHLTKGGTYRGPIDTTYVLEVTRGGVFNRKATVIDGLKTPNIATLTVTGNVTGAADQVLTVDGVGFQVTTSGSVDSTNVGYTPITANNVAPSVFASSLASALNASAANVFATVSGAVVTVRGGYDVVVSLTQAITNVTMTKITAQLTPEVDFDANEWLGGNLDDEYVLRCTRPGTVTSAQFAVESQRGDNVPAVAFTGTGNGSEIAIGTKGLYAYFTVSAGNVPFSVGDEWVIRINATRPQVTITDTSGIDQSSVVEVNDSEVINLGLFGATVTFGENANTEAGFGAAGGLVLGDIFYVVCRAVAAGAYQTLVLADDLPTQVVCGLNVDTSSSIPVYSSNYDPSEFSVQLYLVQAVNTIDNRKRQLPPNFNWAAAADGITVNAAIEVQDPSWTELDGSMPYLDVYHADLFVEYRALIPTYSDTVYSLNDIADVTTTLGVVHPDNPLAQGMYNALSNSGDQAVYFMSVPSDDLNGYSQAFDRVAKVDTVYGMCALSADAQIVNMLEAHVNAMSGPEEKRWRIGFVGTELPKLAAVYTGATHPRGDEYRATVVDNPAVAGANFTVVEFVAEDETILTRDVKPGDKLRARFATDAWGVATYSEYTVAKVLSNTKLLLTSGLPVPVSAPAKVEIWHPRSAAEIATAVADRSYGFANRRIYHVFPDTLYLGGQAQASYFAAAALVGLISSLPPQQGLTNIEVNGFDDVPATYSTYNRQQLNEMAAGGTFLIMQDAAGSKIYVRHQLSTATKDGNLLTAELSITKNLDAISYYLAKVLGPYIGRYNITDVLLDQLYAEVSSGINFLGSDYTAAGLLGPMIILGENTKIRSLAQHPTLKDHVVIIVDLELPVPLNVIQLRLVV